MFVVLRELLKDGLEIVSHAVPSDPIQTVLRCVALTVGDGILRLDSTDIESRISLQMEARTEDNGVYLLPHSMLSDVIKNMDCEYVTFDVIYQGTLNVTGTNTEGTKSTSNLVLLDHADFPSAPSLDENVTFTVSRSGFAVALRVSLFSAAPPRKGKGVLAAVEMRVGGGNVRLRSADGHRLSSCTLPIATTMQLAPMVIPVDALKSVYDIAMKFDGSDHEVITIASDGRRVSFTVGNVQMVTGLLADAFPNTDPMAPKTDATTVVVEREELLSYVKQAIIVVSGGESTPVALTIGDATVTLDAILPETGEFTGTVPSTLGCENKTEGAIALNAKYFQDVLSAIGALRRTKDDRVIQLEIDAKRRTTVRYPHEGIHGIDYWHVITPMANPVAIPKTRR